MRTTLGELLDGEAEGNLTENETRKLSAFRDMESPATQRLKAAGIRLEAFIRSVDPHLRKDSLAAMLVAGRRRGVPFYDAPETQTELAKTIFDYIDKRKTGFLQDVAELTGKPEVENRQSSCLTALFEFYQQEERWPTKKELADYAVKMFPELFREMDERQWRRTREDLGIDWLDEAVRGRKKGA